jgi:F420-dependent oxidoreductase-like protein
MDTAPMRVSLSVTNYSWPGGPPDLARDLSAIAAAAEEAGLHTLWVSDHLLQRDPGAEPDGEMLEAYTTLGYLAAATDRIGLGAMVSAATHRAPALLVKAVTSVDVLSGGRAWLGIGAGYHEEEARAMGLDLPNVRERFERLEETLRIALQLWRDDRAPFEGAHHRLERPVGNPRPLRRPHPPILLGGMGERRTLRLVAQYADACNLFDIPDGGATVRRKLEVLARHCEDLGRPFAEIEKTISTRLEPGEPADAFAARLETLAGLGIQHAVVITAGPFSPEAVETLGEAQRLVSGR